MKLRFGMVGGGGGFIGNVHRHGAQEDDLAVLAAGCFTRDPDKNAQTAERWGVTPQRAYAAYEQMAEAESSRPDGIDFVTIATPNNTHYDIAKAFLSRGIHVLSDKPVAMNVRQAEELERLADEKGLLFGVSYTYANYPLIRQAREMIEHGEIGNIINIMCEYPQDWVMNTVASGASVHGSWRFDPSVIGESLCVADIGTHLEYLVSAMTGLRLQKVLCVTHRIPPDLPLESNAQVLLQYERGIPGMMWASQVAIGHECSVSARIFGDRGAIEWNHDTPAQLRVTRIGQPTQIYTPERDFLYPAVRKLSRLPYGHPEGFYEAFGNIYRGFARHLLQVKYHKAPAEDFCYPTIHDGVSGLRFVEACLQSDRAGNVWINI
ncbi:MAG: Gfo/Idh/MocA family protein [Intestinibacillus sp.]